MGAPEEVFRAQLPRLERCRLPGAVAQAVFKKQAFKRAEKELASIRGTENCRLVSRNDPEIPADTAADLRSAGAAVRARGVQVLNEPSISIVGTRRPTPYGMQMAERLGREIAAPGVVVVSKMARGIDAIAHQGAMVVHGRAIGVLGTGVHGGECVLPQPKTGVVREGARTGSDHQRLR